MKKRLFLLALPILGLAALQAAPRQTLSDSDSGSLKILKFEADWCGACQKMKPVFASVSKSLGSEVSFQSINIDKQSSIANTYDVELLPTIIALKNGKVVGRSTGYMSAGKLKSFIKKHQ